MGISYKVFLTFFDTFFLCRYIGLNRQCLFFQKKGLGISICCIHYGVFFLVIWSCSSLWFGYPIGYLTPSILLLLGIAAIVLTVLSRKEFEQREKPGRIFKKTWKPITAGILEFCGGVIQLAFAIIFLIASIFSEGYNILKEEETYLITTLFVLSVFLAIIGGIYSVRGTNWPLAMTGAIAASAFLPVIAVGFVKYDYPFGAGSLIYMLPGIAAIILTVLSRKEFN